MSFTDNLKRSLGFEETESGNKKSSDEPGIADILRDFGKDIRNGVSNLQNSQQNNNAQNPRPAQNPNHNPNRNTVPKSTPTYDYDDDYVIIPEQSFYEIALIRPKSIDDVNYVVDQVVEEKNPVILDLSFLERESPANFKLAGEKIKQMRARYGAQALLLARSDEKNLIIVSPKKVKLINKN
ncbi:cell division protein SepF [Methanobrevibacter sp.]|uniref:cell division protein SepF n=1 Tax=Methanobrevibacter sp. TaxID=66852 RepID=UPI0026E07DAC|nr:cell division protein SepF [Methanobrevibacter sp.]MDO5860815.1 cell division protein SepF [Methanobrevibacter sp.]